MIRSFVEKHITAKKDVYATYLNGESQQILNKYPRESLIVGYKFIRDTTITKVDYNDFDLEIFKNEKHPTDRFVKKFKEYYGQLITNRGVMFEKLGNKKEALRYYNLAIPFFKYNPEMQDIVNQLLMKLQNK